jgi:hypothetical protein
MDPKLEDEACSAGLLFCISWPHAMFGKPAPCCGGACEYMASESDRRVRVYTQPRNGVQ